MPEPLISPFIVTPWVGVKSNDPAPPSTLWKMKSSITLLVHFARSLTVPSAVTVPGSPVRRPDHANIARPVPRTGHGSRGYNVRAKRLH